MKPNRPLFCLLVCTSAGTFAQTAANPFNATIFGVLDVNARAVKNGTARTYKSESTDGLTSSRIGFRGTEDLGDGLKAGFWLEAPIGADTGITNQTRFFNRRSTVSLIDPTLGEVRLGRDYTPAFTAYAQYDPFGTNGIGEILGNGNDIGIISGLGSGANTLTRADNQVSYILPVAAPGKTAGPLGGLYGQVSVAPGEGTPGNRYQAARLGYATGPVDFSGTYTETKVASGAKLKQAQAGLATNFGALKLSGQFVEAKFASDAAGARKQRVYQVGGSYTFGNQAIRFDYIHGDMSGGAAGSGFGKADDANQYALGYQYNLSKRTALYATAATLRNKGASHLTVAAGGIGDATGRNSNGYETGLRHSF